jgi:hypothetical protein
MRLPLLLVIDFQDSITITSMSTIMEGPGKIRRKGECQGGELNSRPRAYESPALPLSYSASDFASIPAWYEQGL